MNIAGHLASTFQDFTGLGQQPAVSRELFLDYVYSGPWCSQNGKNVANILLDMLEENLPETETVTYPQARGAMQHALSYVFEEDKKTQRRNFEEPSGKPTKRDLERIACRICDEAFENAQQYTASLNAAQPQPQPPA